MNIRCTPEDCFKLITCSSRAKYISPESTLSELDITPFEVLCEIAEDQDFKPFDLCIGDDGKTLSLSIPFISLSKPLSEITTVREMVDVLIESFSKDEEYSHLNTMTIYDYIADLSDGTDDVWWTEFNSSDYCNIDSKTLVDKISTEYGINIVRKEITKFSGGVMELCDFLADRINRAIDYRQKLYEE